MLNGFEPEQTLGNEDEKDDIEGAIDQVVISGDKLGKESSKSK